MLLNHSLLASPSSFKYDNASQQFSAAVNVLHAEGGGDCPQVSFHGLLSVLNLGPKYGSSLFLFTDGSPKDANGRTMQVWLLYYSGCLLSDKKDRNFPWVIYLSTKEEINESLKKLIKAFINF